MAITSWIIVALAFFLSLVINFALSLKVDGKFRVEASRRDESKENVLQQKDTESESHKRVVTQVK